MVSYTIMNYDTLINGLKQLTGQNIKHLSLLFIFDKEKQDNLCKKLNEYENQIFNETDNNKLSKNHVFILENSILMNYTFHI